jgi:RNA polymerase sigma factor (TIGR02999 family)
VWFPGGHDMARDGAGSLDDAMFGAAYDELRRLARALTRSRGSTTLNATALVHEAYIKLARASHFRAESPQHLKYTVVRAMKHVLLDAARRRSAVSRGGGDVPARRVALDAPAAQTATFDPDVLLAVGFALESLARQNEQCARVFELQFFGGLQVAEIAELAGLSEKKVQRLLRMAKAALAVALSSGPKRSPEDV